MHIGPSDHVPWLDDRKWAYVRLEGRASYFMKSPPEQYSDSDAHAAVEAFIRGEVDR